MFCINPDSIKASFDNGVLLVNFKATKVNGKKKDVIKANID